MVFEVVRALLVLVTCCVVMGGGVPKNVPMPEPQWVVFKRTLEQIVQHWTAAVVIVVGVLCGDPFCCKNSKLIITFLVQNTNLLCSLS